jgi:RNAse (barnase) inhibitor barstar
MDKQTITINGDNFHDLETFYNEIDKVLTKDLDWQTGHNLNAFNDLLRGGFGVYDYEEPIKLVWINFSHSIQTLGKELIDALVEIITEHDHIEFMAIN